MSLKDFQLCSYIRRADALVGIVGLEKRDIGNTVELPTNKLDTPIFYNYRQPFFQGNSN